VLRDELLVALHLILLDDGLQRHRSRGSLDGPRPERTKQSGAGAGPRTSMSDNHRLGAGGSGLPGAGRGRGCQIVQSGGAVPQLLPALFQGADVEGWCPSAALPARHPCIMRLRPASRSAGDLHGLANNGPPPRGPTRSPSSAKSNGRDIVAWIYPQRMDLVRRAGFLHAGDPCRSGPVYMVARPAHVPPG
jgi:hypothetical protein